MLLEGTLSPTDSKAFLLRGAISSEVGMAQIGVEHAVARDVRNGSPHPSSSMYSHLPHSSSPGSHSSPSYITLSPLFLCHPSYAHLSSFTLSLYMYLYVYMYIVNLYSLPAQ